MPTALAEGAQAAHLRCAMPVAWLRRRLLCTGASHLYILEVRQGLGQGLRRRARQGQASDYGPNLYQTMDLPPEIWSVVWLHCNLRVVPCCVAHVHQRRARAATTVQTHVRGAIARDWDLPALVQPEEVVPFSSVKMMVTMLALHDVYLTLPIDVCRQ